jgi:UDP-glucose 4-epimerase
MRLLVTGGAGYIGSSLLPLLAADPRFAEILVYDNISHGRHGLFTGPGFGGNVRFLRGDLLDTRNLRKALDGIDTVLHLAAKVSTPFAHGDPHAFEQVNHWGTAELGYLLEESQASQVVYMSSASVYGGSEDLLDSSAPARPRSWYGSSKLRGESMLLRLSDRLRVHVIRCANVYGPGPSARFEAVINRFMLQAHFEGRITIEGDGSQRRPFVHISNACSVLYGLLGSELSSGVYSLVQHNSSVMEIASALRELYPSLEMIFVEQDMPRHGLQVRPSPALEAWIRHRPLEEELAGFSACFAFGANR